MSESHSHIRARAYDIWESEGRPTDRAGAHWLQAERDVLAVFARSVAPAPADKAAKPKRAPRKKAAPRRTRRAA